MDIGLTSCAGAASFKIKYKSDRATSTLWYTLENGNTSVVTFKPYN